MMQIMPSTAKMLSRQEKLKYDQNKVLEDSSYNVQLGSRYIFDLVKEFDGSYIRAISSYNAGPNRIKQWNKNNTTDNVLDWIELIPFKETRYYVKNVLRNVQFYRILLNIEDNKFNILDDLEGNSLRRFIIDKWRGGRVAEGAPLLREYTRDRIVGSNPTLSAIKWL